MCARRQAAPQLKQTAPDSIPAVEVEAQQEEAAQQQQIFHTLRPVRDNTKKQTDETTCGWRAVGVGRATKIF